MSCLKCRITDGEKKIACDGCDRHIHIGCAGLNAQELKVMTLRDGKRTLRYYCEECQEGVRLVPKLLSKINILEEKVNQLISVPTSSKNEIPEDYLTEELLERQKRSCNILIFNMSESSDDKTNAEKILRDLAKHDVNIIETARIGKPNKKGNRALKITLPNANVTSKIITAKKDPLKGKHVYISPDLTIRQRNHYNELKNELNERRNSGENDIIIRYVKGIPTIVKRNLN